MILIKVIDFTANSRSVRANTVESGTYGLNYVTISLPCYHPALGLWIG